LGTDLSLWKESGVLKEASPATSAACRECGSGNVRRLEYFTDPARGRREPYIPCPDCGLVRIELERLRRWQIDTWGLLSFISDHGNVRGPATEVVRGRLWRLGTANWAGRPREVYFARRYGSETCRAVVAQMRRRPKSLLLMPTTDGARRWAGVTTNPVIALDSSLTAELGSVGLDLSYIEACLADAGLTDPRRGRKPVRKRGERAAKIELLESEMGKHLRAAQHHAQSTQELGGTPKLLPRPRQKELAKRTGLTKSDFSRCLNDASAKWLRVLWEAATDLDQVMSYGAKPIPKAAT